MKGACWRQVADIYGGAALTGRGLALCGCSLAEVAAEGSIAGPWQNRDRCGAAHLARVFLNRVR